MAALFAVPGCLTDDDTDADLIERVSDDGALVGEETVSAVTEHGDKVYVCHIPPGNPGNAHTIEVSTSAVPAHLAHGDTLGACDVTCVPTTETCGDHVDNDCDGNIDEGCVCPPGEEWTCYTAPLSTDGIGACQRGIKTCNADGMGYGPCVGEITPQPETCGNGVDDDCDGTVDDGCNACVPTAEVCGDGLDNDCDGTIDDGCVCAPGTVAACYDGPAATSGVGTCAPGTQTCNAAGTGYDACVGSIGPVVDGCGDELDNDCDGVADDGCVCAPGTAAACYSGPAAAAGVGACAMGSQSCNSTGSAYEECVGSVLPAATETCGDGIDNNCDGIVDNGCIGDRMWRDLNSNGVQNTTEPGLAGVTLRLCTSSTCSTVLATTVSAADGSYHFSVAPGTYYISATPPLGGYAMAGKDLGGNDNLDSDFDDEDLVTGAITVTATSVIDHVDGGFSGGPPV